MLRNAQAGLQFRRGASVLKGVERSVRNLAVGHPLSLGRCNGRSEFALLRSEIALTNPLDRDLARESLVHARLLQGAQDLHSAGECREMRAPRRLIEQLGHIFPGNTAVKALSQSGQDFR
jgi:hypothetical protein